MEVTTNDHVAIKTRPTNQQYRDNYDRIFSNQHNNSAEQTTLDGPGDFQDLETVR